MALEIITNNVPREIIYYWDLTEKEKKEFDWIENGEESDYSFFRYKGKVYCLANFMRIDNNDDLKGWHGYSCDSYFSGTLVKYCEDNDFVIVGSYFAKSDY